MQRRRVHVPFSAGSAAAIAAHDAALDRFLACNWDPLAVLDPALAAEPGSRPGTCSSPGSPSPPGTSARFRSCGRSLTAMLPLAAHGERPRARALRRRAGLARRRVRARRRRVRGDRARMAGRRARAAPDAGGVRIHRPLRRAPRGRRAGARRVAAGHAGLRARARDARLRARRERRRRAGRGIGPARARAAAAAPVRDPRGRARAARSGPRRGRREVDGGAGDVWAGAGGLARHMAWHHAVFQLELGRIDRVLAIFDAPRAERPAARRRLRTPATPRRCSGGCISKASTRRTLAAGRGRLGRALGRCVLAAPRRARDDGVRGRRARHGSG